jgi:hypothetical protein
LVNGASYTAFDFILDKAYPGHCINANIILYFGRPAGILLAAEDNQELSLCWYAARYHHPQRLPARITRCKAETLTM